MTDREEKDHFQLEEVAEMLSLEVETIRTYEREGLVRSQGQVYSSKEVLRIRRIGTTVELGVNLAGAEVVCNLLERLDDLTHELEVRKEQIRRLLED